MWDRRDAGRCSVLEWISGGQYVGVTVITIMQTPAGRVLDVQGAKFAAGRWAGIAWPIVEQIARQAGCYLVTCISARPLHRLKATGLKPVATVYAKEIEP